MDDIEELRQENEDLKLDLEDLRNELDDIKQEAFFRSNELRQKLDEANEEIDLLKMQLQNATVADPRSVCDREEGEDGSQSIDAASQISHDSTQGSKATTATRLELDRAKREIKSLKLELVYAKSKAKEGSKTSSGSSQISSGLSTVSALSVPENDDASESFMSDIRGEVERLGKEVKFSRMAMKSEKNKVEKEKKRLLQEIDRLQRINMFNTKEITKLNEQITSKDETIEQLKKEFGS